MVWRTFPFSKIIADIKPKYIIRWTILSKQGILLKNEDSKLLEPERLRYAIIRATVIERIFFLIIKWADLLLTKMVFYF